MEKLQQRVYCDVCLKQNRTQLDDSQISFRHYCKNELKEKLCVNPDTQQISQKCLSDCERLTTQYVDDEDKSVKICLDNGKCKRLAYYCQVGCQKKFYRERDRCVDNCWKDY